jgi:hypothetical protein
MAWYKRREIPQAITIIIGLLFIIQYYITVPAEVSKVVEDLQIWAIVIAAFALGIGAANAFTIHGKHIQRRTPGQWYFSAWLLIIMCVMIIIGVFGTPEHPAYRWLFDYMMLPLGATVVTLMAFFTLSAAYRAFRARNWETILMLVVSVFVFLYLAPILELIFPPTVQIGEWIINVPTKAAIRSVYLAVSVGVVVLGFRILMGRERGYLAGP